MRERTEFECLGRIRHVSLWQVLAPFVAALVLWALPSTPGVLAAGLMAIASVVTLAWRIVQRGRVSCSPDGLSFDGKSLLPTPSIHRACVTSGAAGPSLVIRGRFRLPYFVTVNSLEHAHRLLGALSLGDVERARVAVGPTPMQLAIANSAAVGMILSNVILLARIFIFSAPPLGNLALLPFTVAQLLAFALVMSLSGWPLRTAHLGVDGFRIVRSKRWVRPGVQFIAYRSIDALRRERKVVAFDRVDGSTLVLPFANEKAAAAAFAAFERAWESAREAAEATATANTQAPRSIEGLERRGRTLAAWAADLKAFGVGAQDRYRRRATNAAELRSLLESSAAPAPARVAAAVALSAAGEAELPPLLFRLASETGDPTIERALLRVASGTDAEIERALDEAEPNAGLTRAAGR